MTLTLPVTLRDKLLTGLAVGLFPVMVAAANALSGNAVEITDTDSLIRLVRLRDSLTLGTVQYVIADANLGLGLSLHWSHFLEGLLAPFVWLLRPVVGIDQALLVTAGVFGPAMLGLLAAAVLWAVAPLVQSRRICFPVALLTIFSPPLINYSYWGNADHHVLLVTLVVVSLGAALRLTLAPAISDTVSPAVTLGMATAVGAWVSIESLPYALIGYVGVALVWLTESDERERRRLCVALAWAGLALTLTMVAAVGLDRPESGWLGAEIGRLSWPHIMLGLAGLVLAATMIACNHWPRLLRWGVVLSVAAVVAAAWLWRFQALMGSAATILLPNKINFHWEEITEFKPITEASLFVAFCGLGCAGLVLGWLVVWPRLRHRLPAAVMIAAGVGIITMGVLHLRFCTYVAGIGIAGAALFFDWAYRAPPQGGAGWWRRPLAALSLVVLVAVPTAGLIASAGKIAQAKAGSGAEVCASADWSVLDGYRGQLVLTDIDYSPRLLFRHPGVKVVGALYDRGVEGLDAYQKTWEAPLDPARQEMQRLGIHWLMACLNQEPQVVASPVDPTVTLAALLKQDQIPAWLSPASPFKGPGQAMMFKLAEP